MSGSAFSYAVWAALALAVVAVWALSAFGRRPVAPIGVVVRAITSRPVARVVLVLGWMWLGWHFFAR